MPAKDPKSPAHYLRIGIINPGMEEHLTGLKGWVVVRHEGGSKGEHPHLHCYIQHEKDMTFMTVKNHLWKHELFSGLKGNGAFSQRPHNSLDAWWAYVWKDDYATKRPRMVCWNLDIPQFDIPEVLNLLMDSPTRCITIPDTPQKTLVISEKSEKKSGVKQKSALEKQQAFLAYCRQWYNEFPTDDVSHRRLARLVYEYCGRNGFTTEWCMYAWVSYAYFHLNTNNQQQHEEAADRFCDRLCAKFF